MKSLSENNTLLADQLLRSQREEIEKYRWIESEKAGRDIGWKRASEEWKQKHFAGWKRNVLAQGLAASLFEILWSQQQEIETYKWIESEKNGRDIGWQRAVTEWQDLHYRGWKEHLWMTSVDEVTKTEARSARPIAGSRRRRSFSTEHREKLALAMRAWHEKKKSREN